MSAGPRTGRLTLKSACAPFWTALEAGTTLIDTAPGYQNGKSEEIIARALSERPDLAKGVTVTTKVGHPVPEFDFSYDQTMRSVEWSIEHLERSHFPTLYVHDPNSGRLRPGHGS